MEKISKDQRFIMSVFFNAIIIGFAYMIYQNTKKKREKQNEK